MEYDLSFSYEIFGLKHMQKAYVSKSLGSKALLLSPTAQRFTLFILKFPITKHVALPILSFCFYTFLCSLSYTFLYLPPYSHDLNPIEEKWAHAKQIRRTTNCTLDELFTHHLS